MKQSNPDKVTRKQLNPPKQRGRKYRFLDVDETVDIWGEDKLLIKEIECWHKESNYWEAWWWGTDTKHTYRTRLTREQLAKKRIIGT